jgi:hypothetical protein
MSKTPSSAKEIERLIDDEVRPMNFIKKGKKWHRGSPETICRLTLTKDRWKQEQHYLDIYVSVIKLNRKSASEEPVWHIIGSVFSPQIEEKVEWERCLNTGYDEVSGKPRQVRLIEVLQEKIVPLLQSFETLEGIRKLLLSGQLRAMGVRTELQDLTGYRA